MQRSVEEKERENLNCIPINSKCEIKENSIN